MLCSNTTVETIERFYETNMKRWVVRIWQLLQEGNNPI